MALEVRDLCKTYRSSSSSQQTVSVLRGLSFSAAAGEMVAVMGASGAGKSTLLHLLGGLDRADSGSAHLNGFDITAADGTRLTNFRRQHVGFIFQFHHLLADLTALENVQLPMLIARCKWLAAQTAALSALNQVGLSQHAGRSIRELSGGEQQRIAVARALVAEPRLVLADEPTGNLDQMSGDGIGELLLALCRSRGLTIIVATHNKEIAAKCHRTLLLQDGRLREIVG